LGAHRGSALGSRARARAGSTSAVGSATAALKRPARRRRRHAQGFLVLSTARRRAQASERARDHTAIEGTLYSDSAR